MKEKQEIKKKDYVYFRELILYYWILGYDKQDRQYTEDIIKEKVFEEIRSRYPRWRREELLRYSNNLVDATITTREDSIARSDYYAKLDEKASPLFIEPKGYVFVGYSRQTMNMSNMPSHDKIRAFSEKINEFLGYDIPLERKDSRVVLLTRDKSKLKIERV